MRARFLALLVAAAAPASAQTPQSTIVPSASLRLRAEAWDWFGRSAAGAAWDDRYAFLGVTARAGLAQQRPAWSWRAELAAPLLLGLPDDAVAPAPRGQLGTGASYYAANDGEESVAGLFLKQAFLRFGRAPSSGGASLRVGRFEFNEGLESTPANATLAALKRDRVSQRLIGTFGWSHVQRSFDGVHAAYDRAGRNATLAVMRPTRGAFDVDGWPSLDVTVGYASATLPMATRRMAGDARVFVAHYRDDRSDAALVKTDNRPAAVRSADRDAIGVSTAGAHWVESVRTGIGEIDAVLWGALQFGEWGTQSHRGAAAAAEVGWQPSGMPSFRPWLRAGWYRAGGDDDPADGRHETFFAMLPTPRAYARMPFYTPMNLEDTFVSLTLRPRAAPVTARLDARQLRLVEGRDLWYAGGGAFEETSFGFAGRPGNGMRQLATLFDLSVDWRVTPRWTVAAYGAHAAGGIVAKAIHPEQSIGRFAYLELQYAR